VSDKPIEPFKIGIRERASRSRAALLNALGVKNSGFFINYEWSTAVSRERESFTTKFIICFENQTNHLSIF